MGTNFYWNIGFSPKSFTLPTGEETEIAIERDDPTLHIGKRSAAGHYCWDCHLTLCAEGETAIHFGRAVWHPNCPKCGAAPVNEGFEAGPAAVELGFAKPRTGKPTGVRGCSSFSWAQDPEKVGSICRLRPDDMLIEDEYGETLTGQQFIDMLENNCPVQFTDSVGRRFR